MTERVLLLTALALCHGFNLDTETAVIFQENVKSFGQSVVQLEGSRLVVGAPQEIKTANQTGGLYQCDYSLGTCEPIPLQVPPEAVNMSLGLSLAFATNPFRLLACGPTLHQICKENTYVNGFCFLFGSNLRQSPERFPKALRECPQQESDIAFLIDGSGSINQNDFQRMKNFVSTVMRQFTKSKTLFSLMQYSNDFRTHFTFKDFKNNPNPRGLVTPIEQLTGYTYTATGILKVVSWGNHTPVFILGEPKPILDRALLRLHQTELFSSNNGARKNALKILVVITDGEKYGDSKEYKDVIPEADRRGVIRYVIGVGSAFNSEKSRQELNTIASQPPREHVFQVNNFEALKTIQNQLQEKIFAIEGTQTGSTSSFEYEMSQEGFSASITSNGPLLGAVGSFDWAGGAFLHMPQDKITFINTTRIDSDMNDAYLGYAAEVVLWGRVQTLVLGAPRYQHTGMVVMFRQSANVWETSSVIKGTQIGSYFGASLCSVDVDRDGSSDLVLIGAPHYYEPTRGGQVSVCPLPRGRSRWQCEAILRGEQGHPWGRFGTALTVLGDVNGDKLTDVAIGAPGEQENQGAVYLFHGTSGRGIRPSHSQRIAGSQLSPRLQYFGQSLSGGKDLTMDGLMDLAVGAQGRALLLRSKPVLRVEVTMNFAPRELMRNVYECREHVVKGQIAGEVRVCLRVHKSTRDRLREGEVQSTITYDLALDSTRQHPRAIFDETKNSTRRQTQVFGQNQKCETLTLRLPDCVEDSVIPIGLRLNFSLVGRPLTSFGNLRPVLAVDAQTLFTASFPFEKNCGNDSVCQDDLSITLSFMNLRTLVVGGSQDFNVTVTVKNQGEDSYRTQVAFFYPPGLSYRTVSGIQTQHSWRSWRVDCGSETTQGPETLHTGICSINHPIFPGNSEVTFNIILGVDNDASLGNRLLFKANVTSDNNMPRTNKTEFQLELPVKYTVYMVISSHEASTRYLNFTASEKTSHDIKHQYQFNNLGRRSVPVSVVFWIPTQLNQVTVWDHPQIVFSQNLFNSCRVEERAPPRSDFLAELKKSPELNCSIAVCQRTQCDIQSFGSQEQFSVTLKGNLSFDWYIKTPHSYLEVVSTAEILFDDTVFTLFPGQEEFVRVQTKTKVEPYEVGNPVPLIVGSSVGGLVLLGLITAVLYKLGFFKRQYKDMMSETAPEAAPPQ